MDDAASNSATAVRNIQAKLARRSLAAAATASKVVAAAATALTPCADAAHLGVILSVRLWEAAGDSMAAATAAAR